MSARRWCSPSTFQAPVVFFCQNNQYAISEPVAVQTPRPARRPPGRLRHPGGAGRRQRRARRHGRDARRRSTARAPEAARASSRRSPTGWARTPPPTTRPATATPPSSRSGRSATRSRGCARYLEQRGAFGPELETRVAEVADRVAAELRAGISGLADPPALDVFDARVRRAASPRSTGSATSTRATWRASPRKERHVTTAHPRQGPQRRPAPRPRRRRQGRADGRGHRQARRRVPRHRRAADRVRRRAA